MLQKHQCKREPDRRLPRLMKCRASDIVRGDSQKGVTMQKDDSYIPRPRKCVCPPRPMDREERRNQRLFLQKHINKPGNLRRHNQRLFLQKHINKPGNLRRHNQRLFLQKHINKPGNLRRHNQRLFLQKHINKPGNFDFILI